jgi:hypothetical protein
MKQNLMERLEAYCNICDKETEFQMIGIQNYNGRYALYNCVECDGTHTLQSLMIMSYAKSREKDLSKLING